jgi:hypothetical protein
LATIPSLDKKLKWNKKSFKFKKKQDKESVEKEKGIQREYGLPHLL